MSQQNQDQIVQMLIAFYSSNERTKEWDPVEHTKYLNELKQFQMKQPWYASRYNGGVGDFIGHDKIQQERIKQGRGFIDG